MIIKEEHKYEIFRGDVKLCTQTMEDKDIFTSIANTENYKIFYNGKNVTNKYKKKKKE